MTYNLAPQHHAQPLSMDHIHPGDMATFRDRTGQQHEAMVFKMGETRLYLSGDRRNFQLDTKHWSDRDLRITWTPDERTPYNSQAAELSSLGTPARRMGLAYARVALETPGKNLEWSRNMLALAVSVMNGHWANPNTVARRNTWQTIMTMAAKRLDTPITRGEFLRRYKPLMDQDLPIGQEFSNTYVLIGLDGYEAGRQEGPYSITRDPQTGRFLDSYRLTLAEAKYA